KKKKKAAKPPKPPKAPKAAKPKSRSRSSKIVRMRVVWGVFNNSNQCVSTFEYPRKKEAEELVAKLTTEKKNTHFLQPVKEPIEEKKEKIPVKPGRGSGVLDYPMSSLTASFFFSL